MSSATSTHEGKSPARPRRRRRILALLLMAAAIAYLAVVCPPFLRQYRLQQQNDLLTWAGLTAEEVERCFADGSVDPATLNQHLLPFLEQDSGVALARIWDESGVPIFILTCRKKHRLDADTKSMTLESRSAIDKMASRRRETRWTESVAHLQELLNSQGNLSQLIDDAVAAGKTKVAANSGYAVLQADLISLARIQQQEHPLLREAIDHMSVVQKRLKRGNVKSFSQALSASMDAETALTLILERQRASIDALPRLPQSLCNAAPSPSTWASRLWGSLQGQLVLIPLFTPTTADELVDPAGVAEIIFYVRPADEIAPLAGRCLPALVLVLAAVALFLYRPRKIKRRSTKLENSVS